MLAAAVRAPPSVEWVPRGDSPPRRLVVRTKNHSGVWFCRGSLVEGFGREQGGTARHGMKGATEWAHKVVATGKSGTAGEDPAG